jgi:hypothetical protein
VGCRQSVDFPFLQQGLARTRLAVHLTRPLPAAPRHAESKFAACALGPDDNGNRDKLQLSRLLTFGSEISVIKVGHMPTPWHGAPSTQRQPRPSKSATHANHLLGGHGRVASRGEAFRR